MAIKVTNELNTYDEPSKTSVRIHSHWNEPKKIVIEFVGGEKRTIIASELLAAIKNATNTDRF